MKVVITPQARKQIKKLPKFIQLLIVKRLTSIKQNVFIDTEKIIGYKELFRTRIGSYRIVYKKSGMVVYVVLVGHRKEIYNLVGRLFR